MKLGDGIGDCEPGDRSDENTEPQMVCDRSADWPTVPPLPVRLHPPVATVLHRKKGTQPPLSEYAEIDNFEEPRSYKVQYFGRLWLV